jgi:hypothetical protein
MLGGAKMFADELIFYGIGRPLGDFDFDFDFDSDFDSDGNDLSV